MPVILPPGDPANARLLAAAVRAGPGRHRRNDGAASGWVPALDNAQATGTALITATVLAVQPVTKGRLLALASVELVLDGVLLVLHGVQVVRTRHPLTGAEATGVDLPRYRATDGSWRQAVELPPELRQPLGDAVLEQCCALGITQRRPPAT